MQRLSRLVVGALLVGACARGGVRDASVLGDGHSDASLDARDQRDATQLSPRGDAADAVFDAAISDAASADASLGDAGQNSMDAAAQSDTTLGDAALGDADQSVPDTAAQSDGDDSGPGEASDPVCPAGSAPAIEETPAHEAAASRKVFPQLSVCGTPVYAADPVCGAVCGNGQIDSCERILHIGTVAFTERCDGANLGGTSCGDFGFSAGALACTPTCTADFADCYSCLVSSRTSACVRSNPLGPGAASGFIGSVAIAASGPELGLAWIDRNRNVRFSRLAADFTLLSDTSCGTIPLSSVQSVAASASGWLLQGAGKLVALDASGAFVSSRTVQSSMSPTPGVLVPRPGANPLLIWLDQDTDAITHELGPEAPSGPTSRVPPMALFFELPDANAQAVVHGKLPGAFSPGQLFELGMFAGAFVGDGFEIAMTAVAPASDPQDPEPGAIQLAHIGLDGAVRVDAAIPAVWGPNGNSPLNLTWSGTRARLLYEDRRTACGFRHFVQNIAADGSLIGDPVLVATFDDVEYFSAAQFAVGDDTVLLTPPTLQRLGPTGSAVWPSVRFVAGSPANQYDFVMVQHQGDAVIAWSFDSGALELTRIHVAP